MVNERRLNLIRPCDHIHAWNQFNCKCLQNKKVEGRYLHQYPVYGLRRHISFQLKP